MSHLGLFDGINGLYVPAHFRFAPKTDFWAGKRHGANIPRKRVDGPGREQQANGRGRYAGSHEARRRPPRCATRNAAADCRSYSPRTLPDWSAAARSFRRATPFAMQLRTGSCFNVKPYRQRVETTTAALNPIGQ